MNVLLGLAIVSLQSLAAAADCGVAKDRGDGVPVEYHVEECLGNQALAKGNGSLAEKHFRKALAVPIFEAPNYELKVELAEALCLQGRRSAARREVNEFQCMASVELGEMGCPTSSSVSASCAAMCEGSGSSLSEAGRTSLRARKLKAQTVLGGCRGPNRSIERTSSSGLRSPEAAAHVKR